eukprot:CAMPEP_0113713676 /NCGR_PEP_ID=MMETSP0038_2-20120614/32141_1 /TAXON_ID=2898 /ORGANISM="Cryptomonas paramecium" /LENGTH=125 /DNA_ID=CAMNT_0000640463 /DNA_START=140 /DNA_END=513 /DNA_ORIENTATION=- /assembly_acc=CAM_ASM_000170
MTNHSPVPRRTPELSTSSVHWAVRSLPLWERRALSTSSSGIAIKIWQGPNRPVIDAILEMDSRRMILSGVGANSVYDELAPLASGLVMAQLPSGECELTWPAETSDLIREYLARSVPPSGAASTA